MTVHVQPPDEPARLVALMALNVHELRLLRRMARLFKAFSLGRVVSAREGRELAAADYRDTENFLERLAKLPA